MAIIRGLRDFKPPFRRLPILEAMFMTNSPSIQDVLFYPQMRPKSL